MLYHKSSHLAIALGFDDHTKCWCLPNPMHSESQLFLYEFIMHLFSTPFTSLVKGDHQAAHFAFKLRILNF
jgi:hypothetical protein